MCKYTQEFMDAVIGHYKANKVSVTRKKFGLTASEVQYIAKLNNFYKGRTKMPSKEELQTAYDTMPYKELAKHYKVGDDTLKLWFNKLGIKRKNRVANSRPIKSTYEEMVDKAIHVKDVRAIKFEVGKSYRVRGKGMECVQSARDIVVFKREYLNSYGEKRTATETFQKIDLMGCV